MRQGCQASTSMEISCLHDLGLMRWRCSRDTREDQLTTGSLRFCFPSSWKHAPKQWNQIKCQFIPHQIVQLKGRDIERIVIYCSASSHSPWAGPVSKPPPCTSSLAPRTFGWSWWRESGRRSPGLCRSLCTRAKTLPSPLCHRSLVLFPLNAHTKMCVKK